MFKNQITTVPQSEDLMRNNMLVKHYAGSLAYGTNLPTSDIDFRGIFCGDPVNVRTPFFTVRECEDQDEEDTKLYELAHFMKLCLECNPNIIETLWVDEESITYSTPAYELLRAHRSDLLSSKIAFTTTGYATAQLKRIKGHNKWINNPQPKNPPAPKDHVSLVQYFGSSKMTHLYIDAWNQDHRLVPYGDNLYGVYHEVGRTLYDHIGKLNTLYDGDRSEFESRSPIMIVKHNKVVYRERKEKHAQYWQWKNNRNEARSALEEDHGYDTKHAMHLVRLMRMGVEALRDGVIVVKRPDAKELLEIRDGLWKYEEVVAYAEQMDAEIRNHWYNNTPLSKKPNLKVAASLLMDVQDLVWNG